MTKTNTNPDPIGASVAASRTLRMTPVDVTLMLAVAARIPAVYLAARDRLTTDLFQNGEAQFVLLWRAVVAAADAAGGRLPSDPEAAREVVAVRAHREVAADAGELYYTPVIQEMVLGQGGLVDVVFGLKLTSESSAEGLDLVAKFLNERLLADRLKAALVKLGPSETVADVSSVLEAVENHARTVAGVGVDPGFDAVIDADDYRPPGKHIIPTNIAVLDLVMGGGQAAGEAYALLGPTGGGKTSLGVQLAVEGASLQYALAAQAGPDAAGHWYYFSWELNHNELRDRVCVYGARIDFEAVTKRWAFTTAADRAGMRSYEFDAYVNSPGIPLKGEQERYNDLRRRMPGKNSRLHLVDYSGMIPGHGNGGVGEVARYLRKEQASGRKVAGVVIDYAGLCVQRQIAATPSLRPESEYNMLSGFVNMVRTQVSLPFQCPSWVLHQLHGSVSKKAPGSRVHHSDARGCRNFADNSDFGIQISPRNEATGLLTVHCTKHRRAPGRDDPVVARFDGRLGVFTCPEEGDYVIDPDTRQIVPRDYLDVLPTGPRPRRAAAVTIDPLAGM